MSMFRDWSRDEWIADDKAAHFGLGGMLWLALDFVFPLRTAASLFVTAIIVWECFEYARYLQYGWARDFSDKVSLKDMLLGVLGGFVAFVLS